MVSVTLITVLVINSNDDQVVTLLPVTNVIFKYYFIHQRTDCWGGAIEYSRHKTSIDYSDRRVYSSLYNFSKIPLG